MLFYRLLVKNRNIFIDMSFMSIKEELLMFYLVYLFHGNLIICSYKNNIFVIKGTNFFI